MRRCCGCAQTWGIIVGKALTDPVWFFITDWFAIYLVSKGFKLEESLIGVLDPVHGRGRGQLRGRRRLELADEARLDVGAARGRRSSWSAALGMTLLIPAVWTSNLFALAGLFASRRSATRRCRRWR